MNNEISPTPWGYCIKPDKRVIIEDLLQFPVATTPDPQEFAADMEIPAEEGRGLVLANAEHIVHCVNLHDDLVQALEAFVDPWSKGGVNWEGRLTYATFSNARELLAKCRSEVK